LCFAAIAIFKWVKNKSLDRMPVRISNGALYAKVAVKNLGEVGDVVFGIQADIGFEWRAIKIRTSPP
jgi:hypothetical protein